MTDLLSPVRQITEPAIILNQPIMAIAYLDFELEIGTGDGRTYPLAVLQSPAGSVRGHFDFALGQLELTNRLLALQNALLRSGGRTRRIPTRDEQTVRTFGHELFATLFHDDIRSLFYESRRIAASQGKFLRLKLRILDPRMATLPWEFLFDQRQNEYLCLAHSTPLVRYLEVAQPPQPLPVEPPLRILAMIASPADQTPLNTAIERQRLERALAELVAEGLVELEWLAGETWRDLHRAMRPNQGPWHVFHFIGHGSFDATRDEGLLAFSNRDGSSDLRTATDVARLLSAQPTLRLALLNACEGAYASQTDIFASTAATLVQRGIPAVIAMQYEITDGAAIEFSEQFYDALTAGLPVDSAVTDARRAVSLAINNTLEWGIPVLFMRSPDGEIFRFDEQRQIEEQRDGQHQPAQKQEDPVHVEEIIVPTVETHSEQLTGEQIQALWQALLDAYTPSTLAMLVRFQLNERIETIARGDTFSDQVYHLIDWAERTGRIEELVAAAQAEQASHSQLREIALAIRGEAVDAPVTQATPTQPTPPSTPIEIEWCYVPAGGFLMGSDDYHDDEEPQHTVDLPAFFITKTPITNAQYRAFIDATGHGKPRHWENGQIPKGKEQHPVVDVSWHDANAFCAWAGVRLPSEAQWEKAARGTDGRLYPWGNEKPTDKRCNFNNNVKDTTPIDRYPDGSSPYDCLDMAGNVWEWTHSLYKDYPYDPTDGREVPNADGFRTLRGGSFGNNEFDVRCAYRYENAPDDWFVRVGFRVVSPGAVDL